MDKQEQKAYEEYLNVIMIQNDVIGNAKDEGRAEGLAEGRTEGRAEGEQSKAIEIAKILKTKGMSLDEIAVVTKLTLSEIDEL